MMMNVYCIAKVSGVLYNTGQSLVFRPETGPKHSLAVNVSAGPLAYRYQVVTPLLSAYMALNELYTQCSRSF